ncbi:uncharacterized protein At5g08430-like [Argentina anserina]|uniref:uncharacterized protein At5g08430-like n=1 Tax=Argentina anserina TaxID=57926 RepID=UPI0021764EAE|nr:uncharacterized protein At5g08430-like [Potentilla anserina]
MPRKSKSKKEEFCEGVCFLCKDGGLLMVCDYKGCLKAYHPECAGKDESFVDSSQRWNCNWHSCFMCHKAAKFQCFCCPQAVCGRCLCDSEFAVVKVEKGFCNHCLKLAVLIEEDLDADSDGGRVDFKDINTFEYLFKDYWQINKMKERLSAEDVYTANKLLKKGKNYTGDFDSNDIHKKEDTLSEPDEESDPQVSDYDGGESGEEYMPVAKKKRSKGKQCSVKKKVEAKKREFIGWGSKSLLDFLSSMGKDISKELSQYEVTSMVTDYCKEKKLFDPEKKKKIICDATLQSLLGRKSLFKNSIYNLLTPHFADNLEESSEEDESGSSSEDIDESFMGTCKRQIKLSPKVPDVQKSCFASIIPENIKLVYLKRSLVEELLKQPESFGEKVTGSFVRVKCDPNDYSQKNTHQLLQIKGIKEILRNGGEGTETLLQLSGTFKDFPVSKLSDDDFCKEECEDLHQRMEDGLLKKLTIVELEQKARSLHERITEHWLARELILLQKRIDHANEKGWRRELEAYITKKLLLETPAEQSRLLNEVPEVIAAMEKCDPTPEYTQNQDKQGYDGSSHSAPRESPQTPGTGLANGISWHANDITDPSGSQLDQERDLEIAAAKHKRKQAPSTFEQKSSIDGSNGDLERDLDDAKDIAKRKKVSTTDNGSQSPSMSSSQAAELLEPKVTGPQKMNCENTSEGKVIELSDDDQDESVSVTAPALETPGSDLWYCMSPLGQIRGPYKLSLLKLWNGSSGKELRYKVWREGQSKGDAISLNDAI